jgi:hypothetical protein
LGYIDGQEEGFLVGLGVLPPSAGGEGCVNDEEHGSVADHDVDLYTKFIKIIMIVELIEHRGLLLAASSLGELIGWTIRPRNSQHFFQSSLSSSIVPSALKITLDPSELLGIISLDNHVVAYNRKNIYIIDSNRLKEPEKQGSNLARVIKAGKLMGDDELIRSVAGVDR